MGLILWIAALVALAVASLLAAPDENAMRPTRGVWAPLTA